MLGKNLSEFSMNVGISLIFCFLLVNGNVFEKKYDEEEGREYLEKINNDIQLKTTESVLASWAYESNITDENLRNQLEVSAKLANYTKNIWRETIKYPWKTFKDPDIRRQFQKFSVLGTAILSPPKYERFNKIISDMQSVYGKAKICNYHNRTDCSMQLEPELTEIFVKSRDPDELRYYWEQWRNVAGKPVRKMYKEYVDLSNEAAVLNNFTDNTEFWLKDYEAKDFKQQVESLWEQLRPLYLQLHAYVRRRLREQYGERHVTRTGPIPAHLLGNMWAQSWGNIFNFTAPYPDKPSMDVTPNMVNQGYTPLRMFKLAEEFFTSINLSPMPETFWKNSILEKPLDGRDLICHASAWDFYDGKDFRIKQCTRVTFRQLVTVHHEMGHIQYYLQYKNLPKIYRRGANPGFHEAVGDVMALSVSTPKHLRKIGLLNATQDDAESEINQLFSMALDKIAFLPFGYLMDQWRWSVFEGKTTERDYNCKWWQLREKYQGLSPSVIRTEDDFDPGAKYHTVGNVPYIRYFVSFVIQFQFHRSLCIAANEFRPNDPTSKPLHKCDIYQSKEAGALLKKMLQMGSSKPWPDAMEVITGQRKMDARALLDYFATLQAWLEKENKRTGEFIGWESSQKACNWEENAKEEVKVSDSQGNFDDENIAYSYAEFVRQDDNAFGFPDFLEEVQPSYHAFGCRRIQKKTQANYYLPKRNVFNQNDLYLNKRSQMQKRDEKKFFKLQRRSNVQGLYTSGENQDPVNEETEKRIKRQEVEKSKSINVILSNFQKSAEEMNESKKNILNFNSQENEENYNQNYDESMAENSLEKKFGNSYEVPIFKSLLDSDSNSANSREESKMDRNKVREAERLYESSYNEGSEASLQSKSDPLQNIFDLSRKWKFKNIKADETQAAISRAEKIKNTAQKMLKDYSYRFENEKPFNKYQNLLESPRVNKDHLGQSGYMKVKKTVFPLLAVDNFKEENSIRITSQPNTDSSEVSVLSLKNNAKIKGKLHDDQFFIPVERSGNQQIANNENDLNRKSNIDYLIFVENLFKNNFKDASFKKNIKKKSYTEYHCRKKNPLSYNAVVIKSPPKGEKSDDSKSFWLKLNRGLSSASEQKKSFLEAVNKENVLDLSLKRHQRSRKEFFNDKFFSSVNDNKYNIKNIVQYFGCLQL